MPISGHCGLCFCISSYGITKVNQYIQCFIFTYSINSVLHALPVPIPHRYDTNPSRVCSLLTSLAVNASHFWLLLRFQYCFIILQIVFVIFNCNLTFYYTVFVLFAFLSSSVGIFQIFFSRFFRFDLINFNLALKSELLRKIYSIWISNEIFQRLLLKIGNSYSFENLAVSC